VNDATRLLGGTLGVAIIGSVYASLYGTRLAGRLPATLPAALAHTAHSSVGAALEVATRLAHAGRPDLAAAVHRASTAAFFHGFHAANVVAAAIALGGALLALLFLPAHPSVAADQSSQQLEPLGEPVQAATLS
jgi:hypothetical protein